MTETPSPPDLLDPATFGDGPPRELLSWLAERRVVPAWSARARLHYWVVGAHHEVSELIRDWRRLSSQVNGTILGADRGPSLPAALTDLDPPRHTVLRRAVSGLFKPAVMQRLEATTRMTARRALVALAADGGGDLVEAVRGVPAQVTGELFGIAPEERGRVSRLGHLVNFVEDPSYREVVEQASVIAELSAYAHELAARHLRRPEKGLMAELLPAGSDSAPITVPELQAMIVLLVAAGNGTTIDALVSAVRLLYEHPDAAWLLRRADTATYRAAVEEVLRFATPVNYFARTTTEPIELDGETIAAGERVALYFAAANFDERVFHDAWRFDVTRTPNPQLSFGVGIHSCLGAPLARLELRIVLEELCRHYLIEDVQQSPRRIVSHINNGYAEVHAKLAHVPTWEEC